MCHCRRDEDSYEENDDDIHVITLPHIFTHPHLSSLYTDIVILVTVWLFILIIIYWQSHHLVSMTLQYRLMITLHVVIT